MSAPTAVGQGALENVHRHGTRFGGARQTRREYPTWDAKHGCPGPVHIRIDPPDRKPAQARQPDRGPRAVHTRIDRPKKRFRWPPGTKTANLVYFAPGPEPPPIDGTARLVVVEGEKAADAVRRAGFPAAGLVCGAPSTPGPAVISLLASYPEVVLWPDNDDGGLGLMRRVATELERAGLRRCFWVDPPPELPAHGDAADLPAERVRELVEGAREILMLREAHEPGPRPLADALDAAVGELRRFVRLRPEQYDAVVLWAAHTHAIDACEYSPLLYVTSAVWRSGKSRLFEALEGLVARPWKVISPSEAVLFRKLHDDRPTLLLDEADAQFAAARQKRGDSEPLRAILNAGNRRGTTVPRLVPKGKGFAVEDFRIFGAKAVAGIGELPSTIVDRSVTIVMERLAPGERVEKLRLKAIEPIFGPIRDDIAAALAGVEDLTLPDDAFPPGLDPRAEDGWEPLLAIGRLAGRDWPERAARAAQVLSAERARHQDEDVALSLLRDCQEAFGDDLVLASAELIERLCDLPDTDWRIFRGDRPISAKRVATLLRRFGVEPRHTRQGSQYHRADFEPAWARYSEVPATSVTSVTGGSSEPHSTLGSSEITGVTDSVMDPSPDLSRPSEPHFMLGFSEIPAPVTDVTDVAEEMDGPPAPSLPAPEPGPEPPCFADRERYREHMFFHYRVGRDGWGCSRCEEDEAPPAAHEPFDDLVLAAPEVER